jgi:hypothetical protein
MNPDGGYASLIMVYRASSTKLVGGLEGFWGHSSDCVPAAEQRRTSSKRLKGRRRQGIPGTVAAQVDIKRPIGS